MQSWIRATGLVFLVCLARTYGQGVITTIAGTDWIFPAGPMPAVSAPLAGPDGIAVDTKGNVYAADYSNNVVVRITPDGLLTVVAGNGLAGYSGDGGSAANASLFGPNGVAVDAAGNLFISDCNNNVVRKVTLDGNITTIAGNSTFGFSGDGGPATSAALGCPSGIAVDGSGNLYIIDYFNTRVRKVAPDGVITTFAGNGHVGYSGDGGPATSAEFANPTGLAVDLAGNLYISDSANFDIRKVTPGGMISTAVVSIGTAVSLGNPSSVAVDVNGDLFIGVLGEPNEVIKVSPGGVTTMVAGPASGFSGDGGLATKAAIDGPTGIAVDLAGTVYFIDGGNSRVRKVSADGIINTIAGGGDFRFFGDGGPANNAVLNYPIGIALDDNGDVFVSDSSNWRIRKLTPGGLIATVAGNGFPGVIDAGDGGPATSTSIFNNTGAMAVDDSGDLFISESGDIREVNRAGTITTLVGRPYWVFPPVAAGLVVDHSGNIYETDQACNCIQKLTPAGPNVIVAGNANPAGGSTPVGFSGDGGPAIHADLNISGQPVGITMDGAGNIYFADSGNHRVRRVSTDGIITTVAGNGSVAFSGDGVSARSAGLTQPSGIDQMGSLYIADPGSNRVSKVTSDGTITTVAGNGTAGFGGDGGLATNAALNGPTDVAVDSSGNLYISDSLNNRIREVLAQPPTVSVSSQSLSFTGSSGGAPAPTQQFTVTGSIPGTQFTTAVPYSASWLTVTPSGATPLLVEVTADPGNLPAGTYSATITVECPYASPTIQTVSVSFTVGAAVLPSLQVDQDHLSFTYPRSASARSQTLVITNAGGGSLQFKATASTNNVGSWLQVSTAQGSVTPRAPLTLSVQADPTGLSTGTYSGTIRIAANVGQSQTIPVIMTISTAQTAILLSQTGLSFTAVAGGGVVPPQSFGILNIGSGTVSWTVSTSTLAGGPGWLTTSQTQGSTDASSSTVPTVAVQINPEGLAPGEYYGLVRVDAPGAANTPQVLTASLEVLTPGANPGSVVQPNELVFNTASGANPPGSQELFIYDLAQNPVSYRSGADASIQYAPVDGTVVPQQPTRVVVQPATSALGVGTYKQDLTLQFSDGTVRDVRITTIVGNGGSAGTTVGSDNREVSTAATAGLKHGARVLDATAACTPTKLLPAFISLGQYSNVPAGWPSGLVVQVQDDCGNAMTTGNVTVSFSTGDLPIVLQSLKDGSWHGTWQSSAPATAQITLKASAKQLNLQGSEQIEANLSAVHNPPVIRAGGVVNSASSSLSYVPVSPGALITIYGDNLAESTAAAPMAPAPLPKTLGGAQVLMAGEILPLVYADQKRINAVVPYDIAASTNQQILVRRALTYSRPVAVDVAEAQPEIFTTISSGTQAKAEVVRTEGGKQQTFPISAARPATAGDELKVYCMGLGPVLPAGAAGTAGPKNPEAKATEPVQVRIGGVAAKVLFAGLWPGQIGLYEVDATVPQGAPKGAAVPIVIEVGGLKSQLATIPIQ